MLSNQGTFDGKRKQICEEAHRDDSRREAEDEMDERRKEGLGE